MDNVGQNMPLIKLTLQVPSTSLDLSVHMKNLPYISKHEINIQFYVLLKNYFRIKKFPQQIEVKLVAIAPEFNMEPAYTLLHL